MSSECVAVKVAIRIRPLLEREKLKRCKECVRVIPNKNRLVMGRNQNFTFDYVFNDKTDQSTVYDDAIKPLVSSCIDGYNATVFAYGQTGSGKTFTIEGSYGSPHMEGIIPRAARQLFEYINTCDDSNSEYQVRVSYLEIYLEEVKDLLSNTSQEIFIREDVKGDTIVQGLKEVTVTNADELNKIMHFGMAVRTTGATQMNDHSSRSHAILTIYIDKQCHTSVRNIEVTSAKFHFVDLAGSERAQRTGNVGERFKESIHINSGLLSLGNVISALTDAKRRSGHVPYRDSKITRLLKDSLGGNSRTLMITCISPSDDSFVETLNSIKYSQRARSIKNCPIVNKDIIEVEMQRMESEILQLREQLKTRENSTSSTSDIQDLKSLESSYKYLLGSCISDVEHCILNKSLSGLAKLLEKLKTEDYDVKSSCQISDSVFAEDNTEIAELHKELQQCKEDLANDEKIFAEQQLDFDVAKGNLTTKLSTYEDEIRALKSELERSQTDRTVDTDRSKIPKKHHVTVTHPKSATFDEFADIIQKRIFRVLNRNVDRCLNKPASTTTIMKCTFAKHAKMDSRIHELTQENNDLHTEIKALKDMALERNLLTMTKQRSETEHSLINSGSQFVKIKKLSHREKSGSCSLRSSSETRATISSQSSNLGGPSSEDQTAQVQWLEDQLTKVLKERREYKDLEGEKMLREDIIKQRKIIEGQINSLVSKEVRTSQVISKDLLRMSMKLQKVEEQIMDKSSTSRNETLENDDLKRKRDELRKNVEVLSAKISSGNLLSDAERTQYTDLADALDVVNITIDYRSDLISTLIPKPNTISEIPTNQAVVKVLFNSLVVSREHNSTLEDELKLLKLQLDSKNTELISVHSTLAASTLGELQDTSTVAELQKEVNYYKVLSKDLKQTLRAKATANLASVGDK